MEITEIITHPNTNRLLGHKADDILHLAGERAGLVEICFVDDAVVWFIPIHIRFLRVGRRKRRSQRGNQVAVG